MFLGIEIGGTKLQLGVGAGESGHLHRLLRLPVDRARGAEGILQDVRQAAGQLIETYRPRRIGIGFGGPVDGVNGRVVTSHHVAGWDGFLLSRWCEENLGLPAVLGNDADLAALAEAHLGAARGASPMVYVTVGTGIGSGLVVEGKLYQGAGLATMELGHLRLGPGSRPGDILEHAASGLGIAAAARRLLEKNAAASADGQDLLARAGTLERLTAAHVTAAAADGNAIARTVIAGACDALGWALAQVVTLLSPAIIVVGGGVSLAGERLFFSPLREAVARYVFPPLAGSYQLVPAALGEDVVVHGAILLAREADASSQAKARHPADEVR